MATIRKITPAQGISDFRQMRQEGGGGFRALAGAMDVAYDYLLPKALNEAEQKGDALGREIARQQIGSPQDAVVQSTMSAPAVAADPNAALAGDAMAALGKGKDYRASLIGTESGGNWLAQNSETGAGGQKGHFGRVQFGRARLQEAMNAGAIPQGTTPEQFMASPDLQVAAENWHFGDLEQNLSDLVGREVNGQVMDMGALVAMGHLGGAGGARKYVESGGAYNPSDSFGTSLADYAGTHGGGGSVTASTMGGGPVEAPTVIRGADGKLTSRLFGPSSNPVMQAHDAAAGVAYQSDVFLKAGQDFMGLSEQFVDNPEGFKQAADEYVKAMVESAPEPFRMDIRSKLENEASRRFLGIIDEKHSNIRQRAANSSAALAEKWSGDLSSAIASGNPTEIEAARTELASVLAARERLPGSTWTPEQSANYLRKSEEAGQAAIKKAQDDQASGFKTQLDLVTKAANKMLTAADETILENPLVQQLLPDEWRTAASAVIMRETMGSLGGMTPDEVSASVEDFKAEPVVDEYQVDMAATLTDFEKEHRKAWREDPIDAAMTYFPEDRKPRPLPEFDPANPGAYLAVLQDRAAFATSLVDGGFISSPVLLSDAEAKIAGEVLGKKTPPEIRAAMAGAVVGALGSEAQAFFKSAGQNDPILTHGGALMAHGRTEAANEAFLGAALLESGEAQKPTAAASIAEISPELASALDGFPEVAGQAFETAKAIAAARNPMTTDPKSDEAKAVMQTAIQAALGQGGDVWNRKVGGVQEIGVDGWIWSNKQSVLLPPDVAGEDANAALEAAFQPGVSGVFGKVGLGAMPVAADAWVAAGASSEPYQNGEPIRSMIWSDGFIRIRPVGNSGRYRMFTEQPNGALDDVLTAEGVPYTFDLKALIEATQ